MHNLLLACKQLSFNFNEEGNLSASESGEPQIHTLIFDERLSIQATGTTAPDLPPTEENGVIKRDYEYTRHGMVALLAAIDLLTGKAHPAGERHSQELTSCRVPEDAQASATPRRHDKACP